MDIADLKIISENGIVIDLEGGYAGALGFPALDFKQIVLAVTGDTAEFIQFFRNSRSYHISLAQHRGSIRVYGLFYVVQQFAALANGPG